MGKVKTIDSLEKRPSYWCNTIDCCDQSKYSWRWTCSCKNIEIIEDESVVSSFQDFINGDPSIWCQIWACPSNKQDEIRKSFIQLGPLNQKNFYPSSREDSCKCRFQCHWFGALSWIEYSPIKFAAICFTCFLFSKRPKGKCGSNAFTVVGFQKLKRVNSGKECAFICHMGKGSNYAKGSFGCHHLGWN
jgi:hypothetical protein